MVQSNVPAETSTSTKQSPPATSANKPTGVVKKRKKYNEACAECRKAHKACSGVKPCERCVKMGLADTCKTLERKKRSKATKRWYNYQIDEQEEDGKVMMKNRFTRASNEEVPDTVGTPIHSYHTMNKGYLSSVPFVRETEPPATTKEPIRPGLISSAPLQPQPQDQSYNTRITVVDNRTIGHTAQMPASNNSPCRLPSIHDLLSSIPTPPPYIPYNPNQSTPSYRPTPSSSFPWSFSQNHQN